MMSSQDLGIGAFDARLLLGSVVALLLVYYLTALAYNLLFHPLRHFPGPLLQRASALPWALQHAIGISAFKTQKLHERYGPVVRVAPGHLSFTDPRAWRDIYGALPRNSNNNSNANGSASSSSSSSSSSSAWPEMPKSRVFTSATDDQEDSIQGAGFHEHQLVRRALAQGFSDASLRGQEPVLRKYVDLLLRRLHQRCEGGKVALDLERWYNWTTFDVIGDLVWGQAFGCLEKEDYHPWIAFILGTLKAAAAMTSVIYLGGPWLMSRNRPGSGGSH